MLASSRSTKPAVWNVLCNPGGVDPTGKKKTGHAEIESLVECYDTFDVKVSREQRPVASENVLVSVLLTPE